MMSSGLIYLLIPAAALLVIVLGGVLVMRLQRKVWEPGFFPGTAHPGAAGPTGFQQSPDETREAFVRRHWQRPGVVADGVTLVDLYDRINDLERRLADSERQQQPPT